MKHVGIKHLVVFTALAAKPRNDRNEGCVRSGRLGLEKSR
jgi:hypothetical protein